MRNLGWKAVGLMLVVMSLGGCVAAECRPGSHAEDGKCVADRSDAGQAGTGGDGDSGLDQDAGGESCRAGYELRAGTCRDINECAINNGGCDALTTCTNTAGSRECSACPTGHMGDGIEGCVDVDECATNADDCDDTGALCTNTAGTFSCVCDSGFEGDGIGANGCIDIDECTTDNGGCETQPMVTCTNDEGGRSCGACPTGYTGDGIGETGCVDINECLTDNGGCDPAATCTNTPGGSTCGACPAGYTGDGAQPNGCVPQLATLRVRPGLSGATFEPSTLMYSMTVGLMARYVEVSATSGVVGATITVDGEPVDSHGSRFHWIGISGNSQVDVVITDPHSRTRTYTLNINRETNVVQRSYVKDPAPTQYFQFGRTVAADNDTVVVGAGSSSLVGTVYVFGRVGGTWSLHATLTSEDFGQYNTFGRDGIDVEGDTIVVGQRDFSGGGTGASGAAHVYRRTNGTWTFQTSLRASNGEVDDGFGESVAVSDGRIIVGAPGEDSSGSSPLSNSASGSGAAYVFSRSGTEWIQEGYLKAENVGANDGFGSDVDLIRDTVLVGAPFEDGAGTGINPGTSEGRLDSGAAYIFQRESAGGWSQVAYLKNDESTAAENAAFGYSVSLGTETHAAISAPGLSRAFIFHSPTPNDWEQLSALAPYNADADSFGFSVAMWGPGMVVVSAQGDDSSSNDVNGVNNNLATDSGASYVFLRLGPTLSQYTRTYYLKARNAEENDGWNLPEHNLVGIAGDTVVTVAPREDSDVMGIQSPGPTAATDADPASIWDSGAAYLFR